jgi:hypothetical protein
VADAKTPDPKADPKADAVDDAGTEGEETFEQRQARVGGFPPPHVPGEAPVSPYADSVASADTETTPAGQSLTEDQKAKASKETSKETSKP